MMKGARAMLALGALLLFLHALPASIRAQGIYLCDAPARDEAWRWVTAHFLHRSGRHLAFNLGSLGVLYALFAPELGRNALAALALCPLAAAISWSVSWLHAEVPPFVGASALIYTLLAASAVCALRHPSRRRISLVVLGTLAIAIVGQNKTEFSGAALWGLGRPASLVHVHALTWGVFWGMTWRPLVASGDRCGTFGAPPGA